MMIQIVFVWLKANAQSSFQKASGMRRTPNHNGYPLYRRRDNRIFFEKKISHKIGNKIVNKVVKVI